MYDIEQILNDPVYFAEKYLQSDSGYIQLTSDQKAVLRDLVTTGEFLCERERQWGKTLILCIYAIWRTLIKSDQHIMFMVPNYEQIKNTHTKIASMWSSLPPYLRCNMTQMRVEQLGWKNNSTIHFRKIGFAGLRGITLNDLILDDISFADANLTKDVLAAYKQCLAAHSDTHLILSSSISDREMLENKLKIPYMGLTTI